MKPITFPEMPKLAADGIIAVKSEDFKVIVDTLNGVIDFVQKQQTLINNLSAELTVCREDISKIAKILEDMYNEI